MAMMILKYKIMPQGTTVNLEELSKEVENKVKEYGGFINEISESPVGFGLKAIEVSFSLDEKKGTNEVEDILKKIEGVNEIQIISMGRALG